MGLSRNVLMNDRMRATTRATTPRNGPPQRCGAGGSGGRYRGGGGAKRLLSPDRVRRRGRRTGCCTAEPFGWGCVFQVTTANSEEAVAMTSHLTPAPGQPGSLPPSAQTPECVPVAGVGADLATGTRAGQCSPDRVDQLSRPGGGDPAVAAGGDAQGSGGAVHDHGDADRGVFRHPPRPAPPVVFTEIGPATIVDDQDKVVRERSGGRRGLPPHVVERGARGDRGRWGVANRGRTEPGAAVGHPDRRVAVHRDGCGRLRSR